MHKCDESIFFVITVLILIFSIHFNWIFQSSTLPSHKNLVVSIIFVQTCLIRLFFKALRTVADMLPRISSNSVLYRNVWYNVMTKTCRGCRIKTWLYMSCQNEQRRGFLINSWHSSTISNSNVHFIVISRFPFIRQSYSHRILQGMSTNRAISQ